MPLFERLSQGLRLTPVGEMLARHVMAILQDAQRLEGELAALKGLQTGSLEIASVAALIPSFLPIVLQRMTQLYPGVKVNVRLADSLESARLVAVGDADVALAFLRQKNPAIRQHAVGTFALGAVMPPEHPLASRAQVTFAECARFPLVMPNRELSFHADMVALAERQKRVNVVLETGSLDLMRGLALLGLGIAFLNRFGVEKEIEEGTLRHIPLRPAANSQLGAYVRAERALPPALDAFARIVADEIADREAQE